MSHTPPLKPLENETKKEAIATNSRPSSLPPKYASQPMSEILLFWFDWSLKVIGVAAAVVFGIWAPLSYQAANSATASGNDAQLQIISAASVASSQASVALSMQTSAAIAQSLELAEMNSRIAAIGQLWLLDFCLTKTAFKACGSYTVQAPLTSLISYLAKPTGQVTSSTPSATSSSTQTTGPGSTGSPTPVPSGQQRGLALPVLIGVVFAVISFLGMFAGIFVYRVKRMKRWRTEEE